MSRDPRSSHDPRLTSRLHDEEGLALIFVMFAVLILSASATIVFNIAQTEAKAARESRDYENALPVTEAGIDAAISIITAQKNFVTTEGDGTTLHTLDLAVDDTLAKQKAWALAIAQDPANCQAATNTSLFLQSGNGEVCAIRPSDTAGDPVDLLFGVGFVPSRANPEKIRVVRVEYDRGFYSPTKAILTEGNLIIQGAVDIDGDGNPDPRFNTGSVHTNGDLALVGGSPSIEGELTYSGTFTGTPPPNSRQSPDEYVPEFTARDLYVEHQGRETAWYNLCSDGRAMTVTAAVNPGDPVDDIPCDGVNETVAYDATAFGAPATFNGFSFSASPATWDVSGPAITSGVYYVHHGSVTSNGFKGKVGTAASPAVFTLIIEATTICPTSAGDDGTGSFDQGGNLNWKPFMNDILVIADRDIEIRGNPSGGTNDAQGFYGAVEQISLGGNTSLFGATVGRDVCDTASSPVSESEVFGSVAVTHKGGLAVPVESLIRVTAWNEI